MKARVGVGVEMLCELQITKQRSLRSSVPLSASRTPKLCKKGRGVVLPYKCMCRSLSRCRSSNLLRKRNNWSLMMRLGKLKCCTIPRKSPKAFALKMASSMQKNYWTVILTWFSMRIYNASHSSTTKTPQPLPVLAQSPSHPINYCPLFRHRRLCLPWLDQTGCWHRHTQRRREQIGIKKTKMSLFWRRKWKQLSRRMGSRSRSMRHISCRRISGRVGWLILRRGRSASLFNRRHSSSTRNDPN